MSMIGIGRILTLDNGKEYAIAGHTNYENNDYVYIVNMTDKTDTKICIYKDDIITEIIDEDILKDVKKQIIDELLDN